MEPRDGFFYSKGYLHLVHNKWSEDALSLLERTLRYAPPTEPLMVVCQGTYRKRSKDACFLKQLNRFNIDKFRFYGGSLNTLDALEEGTKGMTISKFEMIEVTYLNFAQWEQLIRIMGKLQVKSFCFTNTVISNKMLKYFCEQLSDQLSCLDHLEWRNWHPSREDHREIVKYLKNSNVTWFNLSWVKASDLELLSANLVDTKLTMLQLRGCTFDEEDSIGKIASMIRNNSCLEVVDLTDNRIPFAKAGPILDACFDRLTLRELVLCYNGWCSKDKVGVAKRFRCHPSLIRLAMVENGDSPFPLYMQITFRARNIPTRTLLLLCSVWTLPRLRVLSNSFAKFIGSNVRLLAFTLFGIQ